MIRVNLVIDNKLAAGALKPEIMRLLRVICIEEKVAANAVMVCMPPTIHIKTVNKLLQRAPYSWTVDGTNKHAKYVILDPSAVGFNKYYKRYGIMGKKQHILR